MLVDFNLNHTIADCLATFQQLRHPFECRLWTASAPEHVLSEVLTDRAVLDALATAAGAAPPIAPSGLPG
ncbi:hypothetical protein [Variovorax gossypii]